jgi:hypothetical protein
MTTKRPGPKFTGVDTYQDRLGRFFFRYPMDWHQFQLQDGRDGVLFSPQAENPTTWFAVWVEDLKEHVVAEDLQVVRQGVDKGLSELPGVQIESATDSTLGNLLKFERIYTFQDGEATRKWKQWLLYVDHWLMVVTFQGESPEEWEYWLPMGNYSFAFFNFPQALWFAVDRELAEQRAKSKTPFVDATGVYDAESEDAEDAGE